MLVPVILAGGSGTRLWPVSRELHPKQFLRFGSDMSFFQQSILRAGSLSEEKPIVMASEEHRFLVAEQLRQLGVEAHIILEPCGRNTAPSIAVASAYLSKALNLPEAVMVVLASDHVMDGAQSLLAAVSTLASGVVGGAIGVLGVEPDYPATGYGYIQCDLALEPHNNQLWNVERFIEKPPIELASELIKDPCCAWNSGMFVATADTFVRLFRKYCPDILEACIDALKGGSRDLDFLRLDQSGFTQCRSDSFDYAVMEPLSVAADGVGILMAKIDNGWSDAGSWNAFAATQPSFGDGNVLLGEGEVVCDNTQDTIIHSSGRLIATLGINNLLIADTGDALLVAERSREQDIKTLVQTLRQNNIGVTREHVRVHRPWGFYETLDDAVGFKVKRLCVHPGHRLSLQRHEHRAEHWIVVSGVATTQINGEVSELGANESVYVPRGVAHSLSNQGAEDLVVIEVQTGSQLNEADIVRLDDPYHRS
ncbi:mannose-1-phosphate guanylyltransferase/mannose-6-phosphate isomerase [Thalassolituus sp.]|uniref:mannose-1-phosphate guanylyltransferase/mannose-6-phosphate isomerase n=1 Tax=Thalassolituus sp. TaxID=2030822 RepID=UPI003515C0CD